MKARTVVRVFVIAFLVMVTSPAQAQYTVQKGDTLWVLADKSLDSAQAWESVYEANPFLQSPGRRFVDATGRTIVVLHPGETLAGLDFRDIVEAPAFQPAPIEVPAFQPAPETVKETVTVERVPNWLWWLVALLGLLLFGTWLYSRPTSWRPMVQGGIDDVQASTYLGQQAGRRGATVVHGSQERVRLFGTWGTRHRGVPVPIPHTYNGERAWRARFRMTNGTEQSGFMLQSCGNDVTIGGAWYVPGRGARVEDGWGEPVVAPVAPIPEATPAPVTEVEPAAAIVPTVVEQPAVIEDGVVKFEIRRATADKPAMVRMTGIDGHGDAGVEIRENEVVLRFTPRK